MSVFLRVLVVENDENDALLVVDQLRMEGFDPCFRRVDTDADFRAAIAEESWDVVLADFTIPSFGGIQALEIVSRAGLDIPFLIVSGSIGEEQAVEAMRRGAHDYLMKDKLARLGAAVRRELREYGIRRERRRVDDEIRRLNSELVRQVDMLRRLNSDLEQFAYAASHDLKEPLRSVTGFSELLLRKFSGNLDPEVQEFAHYVRDGVERVNALMDGLLAYSRVAKEGPNTLLRTDASRVVQDVLADLHHQIKEAGAEIRVSSLPDVIIERAQLHQIFHNLIGNGLKYRRSGVAPRIEITAEESDRQIRFAVRDNGLGIRAEHRERIFALFRRLHRDEFPGIGVGLAVCKKLVERAGGSIWVESEAGAGSTFHFTLPAAETPHLTARRAAAAVDFAAPIG